MFSLIHLFQKRVPFPKANKQKQKPDKHEPKNKTKSKTKPTNQQTKTKNKTRQKKSKCFTHTFLQHNAAVNVFLVL